MNIPALVLLVMLIVLLAVVLIVLAVLRSQRKKDQGSPIASAAQPAPRRCPQCGAVLQPDATEGLCPSCLLQRGLGTEGGGPAGQPAFVPPTLSELAELFPQLEILEPIGKGGMGAVYKARQPALERYVALKILAPRSGGDLDFTGRFTREARALARLNHPNIVGVYDFGQVRTRRAPSAAEEAGRSQPSTPESQPAESVLHYFIMEYVDGPNLRQVQQAGRLAPREALEIIPQICAALQFAHDEGIVHRDIKPENVLLDKKGRVKIADFGLAKIVGQEPQNFRLTGAKDIMGTPHYMAPEQVEKPQEVDHRADIYSLGVVFYEMLTGELPLGKFAPPSSRMRGVQVDVRLDDVVLRTLEKEPERRYQQASEVKTAVETISSTGNPAPSPAAGQPAAAGAGRVSGGAARTWLFASGTIVLIGVGLLGLLAVGALVLAIVVPNLTRSRVNEFAFEPETEFSLDALSGNGTDRYLDLDQGEFVQPPRQFSGWSGLRQGEWLREKGVDLMIIKVGRWRLLTPVNNPIKLSSVPSRLWQELSDPFKERRLPETFDPLDREGVDFLAMSLSGNVAHPEGTFTFETAGGARGLLRINGLKFGEQDDEPIGLRLRIKKVGSWYPPVLEPAPAAVEVVFPFGRTIERTLSNNTERDFSMIDLDRNRIFVPDKSDGAAFLSWLTNNGVDAIAMTERPDGNRGLASWVARSAPARASAWDTLTPALLAAQLESAPTGQETIWRGENVLPATFLFQTREGGQGILQILSFNENPRAVRFRYKLVQTPGAQVLAESTKDPGAAVSGDTPNTNSNTNYERDYVEALATANIITAIERSLDGALGKKDAVLAHQFAAEMVAEFRKFNQQASGSPVVVPQSAMNLFDKGVKSFEQGRLDEGKAFFDAAEAAFDASLADRKTEPMEQLEKLAAEQMRGQGRGPVTSGTNAAPRR